jgi:peptide/nickel transport system permease protein
MTSYRTYILKQILLSLFTVFCVSVFVFLILQFIPGDPVRAMMGADADNAAVLNMREQLNLNKPILIQYIIWAKNAICGDFGTSLILKANIAETIATRLPVTLWLTIPALMIATVLGTIIGVVCATHRGSVIDQVLTLIMTMLNGAPIFWIGIMMMYLFGVRLKWLPLMGYVSPMENFGEYLAKAIMPVTIIAIGPLSSIARQVRTNMLEVINQDYIRTARAQGLSDGFIKYRYALKNSLIPIITLLALQVRSVVGGSLLGEQVFSIAGMGRLILTSVTNKDYLVVQALSLVISIIVVLCNLLLDISYGLIDPRIRISSRGN